MAKDAEIINREDDFYAQLDLSKATIHHYKVALNSKFMRVILSERLGYDTIFAVSNLKLLWELYSVINLHPRNIADHRVYSAAINKYIKYLNNGQKYGKRIDYKQRRKKND